MARNRNSRSLNRDELARLVRQWKKHQKPLPAEWEPLFSDNQKDFLKAIRFTRGAIAVACDIVGIGTNTVRNWKANDNAFRNAMSEQVQAGIDDVEFTHMLAADEDVISRIHVLKCKRPEVWNEDARVRLDVNETKTIRVELPSAEQAKMLAQVVYEMQQLMSGGKAMLVEAMPASNEKTLDAVVVVDTPAQTQDRTEAIS